MFCKCISLNITKLFLDENNHVFKHKYSTLTHRHTALWSILRCDAYKHAQSLVYGVSVNSLQHTKNTDRYFTFCYHCDMFVLILIRGHNVGLKELESVNSLLNMNYFIVSNWQPQILAPVDLMDLSEMQAPKSTSLSP